ncbi:MAG TPA: protein phosphatase 2C domain-containing protein [Pseudonocardiaceae bacterium]|jgi:protein phosphatase|nr:protein phosphatase 2C domain-containing protein [Pseudonocardiaceae bacterium]
MTLVLKYVARSDRGLVRSNNQDSVYAGPRLLAVADGMGGHAAGEVASKIVIAALAPLDDDEPGEDLLSELREAVHAGNSAISELVAHDPELEGMGTTLTAILFAGNRIGLVNIGDSRTYLMRNASVSQITHDDTFVQSLIDEGRITPEEANSHPQRSLLLRALTGHEMEPTLTVREARAGDRYLLCSDGLSGVISHETLAEAAHIQDPQSCADRMIELALKGGGPDNVTVIVADVVDVDFGEDAPIVGGAAGDGTEVDPPPGDSPASRASALNPAPPQQQRVSPALEGPPSKRKRRWLRALVISAIVLLVLAGAAFGTYWAVLRQYYVGVADSGEIAVFQGVPGSILGVQLHRQVEGSCPPDAAGCEPITVNDLTEAGRVTVGNGITHLQSMDQARGIIQGLRTNQVLPECPKPATGPTTPTTTTTAPGPHLSTTVHPAGPTSSNPLPGSDHGNGQVIVTTTPTATPPGPTAASTAAPEPGINCRKAGS